MMRFVFVVCVDGFWRIHRWFAQQLYIVEDTACRLLITKKNRFSLSFLFFFLSRILKKNRFEYVNLQQGDKNRISIAEQCI